MRSQFSDLYHLWCQAELDRTERSYAKVFVDLESYDGRPLKGFVYYNAKASGDGVPSKRYLGVLVKGLKQYRVARHLVDYPLSSRHAYTLYRVGH